MAIVEINRDSFLPYEEKMTKTLHVLQEEFNSIRAGRANSKVLDRISIDYYGVQTPINQVANIQIPEPRIITISPWDPSSLKLIEKSIQASDLGINPSNDGKMIRLVFPALTEERRRDLVKQVSKYGEESKIAIRNLRREGIDHFRSMLKKKEITEDQMSEVETNMQKLTDKYISEIDKAVQVKEADLMEL
ncbi:MAG: ribosome recycling factor [Clostridiales bacterium]|jgi:ribosome recycling factor|nr:ribosome recycling factor [Eubacteriales bacterium]MDD3197212.1 ribosome recycling factor [Eubacteriales bacterium]MDD3502557.1 ribosome recycling factor [Eubacteriales bacterium]MDD4681679.1 ribosome recycling factor [Eubacteriales bacterium]MDN5313885.1 ribosome recycling factor [Clostridiales bacterium]